MLKLSNITYNVVDQNNVQKTILNNFCATFQKGQITAITGVNGAGKSTLIKIIMGILQQTNGKIQFAGKDVSNLSLTERAKIGFTIAFQQPVLFKGIKVKDLFDVVCGQSTKLSDACDFLSAVGLCAKKYINRQLDKTLSGGELKRIEIALALAKGGQVFLFDEPEAGIDLWSFDELVGVFKKLKDKIVIVVSHQRKILELADQIVLFDAGNTYKFGTSEQILQDIPNMACSKLSEASYE